MRTVTYKCNVCQEEIKDYTQARTIYYDSVARTYVMISVVRTTEYDKQICLKCIEMIKTAQ